MASTIAPSQVSDEEKGPLMSSQGLCSGGIVFRGINQRHKLSLGEEGIGADTLCEDTIRVHICVHTCVGVGVALAWLQFLGEGQNLIWLWQT